MAMLPRTKSAQLHTIESNSTAPATARIACEDMLLIVPGDNVITDNSGRHLEPYAAGRQLVQPRHTQPDASSHDCGQSQSYLQSGWVALGHDQQPQWSVCCFAEMKATA